MSDQPERYPFIEASLELCNWSGELVARIPNPPTHGCALPPGWVKGYCYRQIPRRLVYEGPAEGFPGFEVRP